MNDADQILVFDRVSVRRHRDRAARNFALHNALTGEVAEHMAERLGDIKRDFPVLLNFGPSAVPAERKNAFVVNADLSENMLRSGQGNCVVADEEYLPFAPNSFDLILGNLNLHWVNDLPGALAQIKSVLRPGGLLLAALLGGETLHQLRTCLTDAELSVTKGVSVRVSPQIDLPTASGLLQRAGFSLPVADREIFTLTYPDAFALMRDVREMGESNASRLRPKHFTRRAVLFEAARLYHERFGGPDGRISASFEVIFMHGWKNEVGG